MMQEHIWNIKKKENNIKKYKAGGAKMAEE
jgi:hypothetical protein